MTTFTLVRKNLGRNKLRTTLTIVALAFPLMIFLMVMTSQDALGKLAAQRAKHLRLATIHRTSLTNYLPHSHRARIEELDPEHKTIVSVCALRWLGGRLPGTNRPITSLAADADTYATTYPEYKLTGAYLDAWNENRQAAVVGGGLAAKQGWSEGQRITLIGTVPPYSEMEFTIVRVGDDSMDDAMFFRMDYFDEILERDGGRPARANMFLIKSTGAEVMPVLAQQIDERFLFTPDQTRTVSESAFLESFIQQEGNLPRLLRWLGVFVVFVVGMVTLNTMSMSYRERVRELAVFRAVGFSPVHLLGLILGESLVLTLAAGLIAGVPIWAVTNVLVIGVGPMMHIEMPLRILLQGFAIAAVIGLGAGIAPAIWAGRIPVAAALRRVV